MSSIFSKIVAGDIPSYKVAEDERFLAFFDISPLAEGHTLVIPKVEIGYLFAIDDVVLADMVVFAKKVALAIEKVVPCKRIGVAVLGLEVPHAHIHLIPINHVSDIDFSRPKLKLAPERFIELQKAVQEAL
ncbi:MAG TPA: HIT family protein [Bacteroidales bacterium]|nr:MAG: HIT family hydrolase [Bacteroidetes bacterium GWE2_42_24]OFY32704.1 MAG: HIT family hydrolase [Bacteroidetes bacterium GWF2_43_11]HAQ66145.1 HIT family protein [Bacteroidales bacterium]HBZ65229.1 HIT family protein [Bacteroidales bacterium]